MLSKVLAKPAVHDLPGGLEQMLKPVENQINVKGSDRSEKQRDFTIISETELQDRQGNYYTWQLFKINNPEIDSQNGSCVKARRTLRKPFCLVSKKCKNRCFPHRVSARISVISQAPGSRSIPRDKSTTR